MNRDPSRQRNEFPQLLESLCDGDLSTREAEKLDQFLREDPAARRAYLDRMAVETELHLLHGGGPGQATLPAPESANRSRRVVATRWSAGLAIAASLLVAAFGLPYLLQGPAADQVAGVSPDGSDADVLNRDAHASVAIEQAAEGLATARSETPAVDAPLKPVARITATRNCRWANPDQSIGYGAELTAGQTVNLTAGIAELTFESGAKVTLEGPASFEVGGGGKALLMSGQLAAKIPRETNGFWLHTARFGVGEKHAVPQDAEFGLIADGAGGGEVHVFGGRLHAHLLDAGGGRLKTVELAPREAARVTPASTTVAKFHANHDRFVRSLFSGAGPHDGLYAYESFDYAAGPLSGQNGDFGWAGPWADIEATALGEDATNRIVEQSLPLVGMVGRGGAALQSGQRNRVRRALSTSLGGVFDSAGLIENRDGHRLIGRDGRTLYVSFLQRVSQTDDVFYGFELHRGDGNVNRVLCIGNGADGAGYGVTSNYNAYGAKNYPSLGDEDAGVNFIVVRINFGNGDRDVVSVYRNPESLLDEGECQPDAILKGNFAFDRISLGNFDGSKTHEIDEVRIGTAFRAVTGQRNAAPDATPHRRVASRAVSRDFLTHRLGSDHTFARHHPLSERLAIRHARL